MKLTVALVQFNPIIGRTQQNISKINQLLKTITTPVDLVVLPELAITGYNFSSPNTIAPYLESSSVVDKYGPSLTFASELSKTHNCFTVIGYPETSSNLTYNSCAMFNRNGQLIHNYRKTFLYETDEIWGANENKHKGFQGIEVDFGENSSTKVNFGICMDLNPYQFKAPFNDYEFSSSCYNQRSQLIICPMAWLSPKSPSIIKSIELADRVELATTLKLPNLPNQETINYWILRFFPYISHKYSFMPKWFSKPVNVLCCNRVGVEEDIVYGGSSSIIQFNNNGEYNDEFNQNNKSVNVLGSLSEIQEGILIKEIEI
ncbi:amidase [Spathaspora sp. JA1]|nr:amidase [Spathaspora sp. JA1]